MKSKNCKIAKFLFALMFTMISTVNCSAQKKKKLTKNSDIISISYRHTAGRGGGESISATKDSLLATSFGGMFKDAPNVNKKIKTADWQKLVSMIDTKFLDKIENGKTRGQYDGSDEFFEISTPKKVYKLVNIQDSVAAKQLISLKIALKKMVSSQK